MDQQGETGGAAGGDPAVAVAEAALEAAAAGVETDPDGAPPALGESAPGGAKAEASEAAPLEGVGAETVAALPDVAEPRAGRGLKEACRAFLARFERGAQTDGRAGTHGAISEEAFVEPEQVLPAPVADQPGKSASSDRGEFGPFVRLPAEAEAEASRPTDPAARPESLMGLARRQALAHPAFAAVALVALGGVSAGAIAVLSGGSRADLAHPPARPATLSQVAEPGLMAPSVKLAMVPQRDAPQSVLKEAPPRQEQREMLEEIQSFGAAIAKAHRDGVGRGVDAAPAAAHPSEAGGPGPATPQEVGISRLPATVSEAPKRAAAPAPGTTSGAGHTGEPGRAPHLVSPAAPAGDAAREEAAKPVEAPVKQASFRMAVARPGDVTEEVRAARSAEPARREPLPAGGEGKESEKQALALVAELGALLTMAQEELAALKVDHDRLRKVVEEKLSDLDYRMTFAEARGAVEAARVATLRPQGSAAPNASLPDSLPAPTSASEPAPVRRPVSGSPSIEEPKPRIIKAKATERQAEPRIREGRRYRVQAASPHLAMLAEMERSGDRGAQIEVVVGDEVAGFGRVTQIVQRGTNWVVVTDQGTIQ